ncbi:MAG: Flp pilus assembly complex ATPase component TadA, partial [Acidobacteria bacterium]|nr:Flp pilus assembly complex ATPase component TadA [Acidobacteriota bacterium]
QAGLISEENLRVALAEHKRSGERIGAVLVRMRLASEKQIAKALAYQLGFPYLSLTEHPAEPAVVGLIPRDVAERRLCMAVSLEKNLLTVAMADPLLFSLVQDLEFQTGYRIRQVVATQAEIVEAIQIGYPDKALARTSAAVVESSRAPAARPPAASDPGSASGLAVRAEGDSWRPWAVAHAADGSEGAPIVDLVDLIIKSAVKSHASDVHIEPMENSVLVRHRLDGLLKEVMDLPKWVLDGLTARIKILASLDIAEKRLPQDGRLRFAGDDNVAVDFRVSTLRTLFGEKVVLRVLDHRKGVPPLNELGFSARALEELKGFLRHQHGMVLVVGPTGSGKTTTLAAALTSIQSERTNTITIEDPIEYQLPGINQTQVNEKIKLTFASALRSILRQDPDVILLGEIRDQETARIAFQAAQTGHLVLSTLHTDDAASTITRLMDIGMEPYVIASALIGVVAQRLVRRLCLHCRKQYTPSPEVLRTLSISDAEAVSVPFYHAAGCERCNFTGYHGRMAIYEVMRVTSRLRRMIAQAAPEDAVCEAAHSSGMISMGEDGIAKIKSGVTSADELLRVVTEPREMRTVCPGCGEAIGLDFLACPHCGRRVSGGCSSCGRGIQPGWKYCPYCATSTERRERRRIRGRVASRELPATNIAEFKKS